jgi:hypothetical protein
MQANTPSLDFSAFHLKIGVFRWKNTQCIGVGNAGLA